MIIEDEAIAEINRARAAGKSYEQINAVALLSIAISQKRVADTLTKLGDGEYSIYDIVQNMGFDRGR